MEKSKSHMIDFLNNCIRLNELVEFISMIFNAKYPFNYNMVEFLKLIEDYLKKCEACIWMQKKFIKKL